MFRCKPFVTNCTTILLLSIIRTFAIFQTSFGVNIRPWLVVMFMLSCITTISFNLYFKRVPCTSKNHRQTLTADNINPGCWDGVDEFWMQNVTSGLLSWFFAARCFASAVYVVMRCQSICVSVTFVDRVKMNKHIIKIFPPSCSHAILVIPRQTA